MMLRSAGMGAFAKASSLTPFLLKGNRLLYRSQTRGIYADAMGKTYERQGLVM
jgi:hypothetical protein